MNNLLWHAHQDSKQFSNVCEKWDDGKPLTRSTLQITVSMLVDEVHIALYLTCLVTEFLGTPALATAAGKKQDGATAAGWGRQPTKNLSIPHLCTSTVREFNRLYPWMDIVDFSKKVEIK
jgi:hypothetical protein